MLLASSSGLRGLMSASSLASTWEALLVLWPALSGPGAPRSARWGLGRRTGSTVVVVYVSNVRDVTCCGSALQQTTRFFSARARRASKTGPSGRRLAFSSQTTTACVRRGLAGVLFRRLRSAHIPHHRHVRSRAQRGVCVLKQRSQALKSICGDAPQLPDHIWDRWSRLLVRVKNGWKRVS